MVGYSKRTVDKRLKYLAAQSAKAHDEAIAEKKFETSCVQVDEMETYEHTRCKPLSIAMAVRQNTCQEAFSKGRRDEIQMDKRRKGKSFQKAYAADFALH